MTPSPVPTSLRSLPAGYRAMVIGASGGIGAAFVAALRADPRCADVLALHRRSSPPVDFDRDESVGAAAQVLAEQRFQLVINAAGVLHGDGFMPERRLSDLNPTQMMATFRANTFGPALVIRSFAPLLDRERGVMALLSAKVGSIEDNQLGGWTSYRASKAALNMIVKTAAIELKRTMPKVVLVALHPGTVSTALSAPFRAAQTGRPPALAVAEMLAVLDRLGPGDSGNFLGYDGRRLPW